MSREPRRYHEDADLFREALSYTQSETGFSAGWSRRTITAPSSWKTCLPSPARSGYSRAGRV